MKPDEIIDKKFEEAKEKIKSQCQAFEAEIQQRIEQTKEKTYKRFEKA